MKSAGAKKGRAPAKMESGAIRKDWRGKTRMALVYPNHYAVGMSNLGFQTVYRLANEQPHVVCERAFLNESSRTHLPVFSEESSRPLKDFDVVAFSVAFENDYPNIVQMMHQAGIASAREQRSPPDPLLLAGGVACMLNPEPLAPFFDCFLIGEAEHLIKSFFDLYDPAEQNRRRLLAQMAAVLPGLYVPEFYQPRYTEAGRYAGYRPLGNVPARIELVRDDKLIHPPACSSVLSPQSAFDSAYLIEVGRGCPHGCRFCSAGFIYRPPRFQGRQKLADCIQEGARWTDRIGLVGAAVSDLPDIDDICQMAQTQNIRVSFSSLRADALSDELVDALVRSKVKTATIAPDAGSERLRRVINKNLTEDVILTATEKLVGSGIANLRLYFMMGLPTETEEDIDALIELVQKIRTVFVDASRPKGRLGNITVGLNCFVPKPSTPFQWAAMATRSQLKRSQKKIRRALDAMPNVRVHSDRVRGAIRQAVLSRGDRRVAAMISAAPSRSNQWQQALKQAHIDLETTIHQPRAIEGPLPWDVIDTGIRRQFLWNEYQRALKAKSSAACPSDECRNCRQCRDAP